MVATTLQPVDVQASARLTMQTLEIASETTAMRSLDWDRDRFDIEFALINGTTYNSFLICGDQVALIDTSHQKFHQLYLEVVTGLIDPQKIDYLIISHTEPDHSGLVKEILQRAPQITLVGSKVAIQFLENMVHQPFQHILVRNGDRLDLGQGHELEFISAPNLHWPDTIFTFDHKTGVLFTCDAFGMHYCNDHTFDEEPDLITADYQYYYDCLMAPNARSVLAALKRIEKLEIQTIATGHGPLLRHHLSNWVELYHQWSQAQAKTDVLVAVFYAEEYVYAESLARAIAHGIIKTEAAVELIDLTTVELQEIREIVSSAAGLVIAMPPQSHVGAHAALSTILAAAHPKQTIGLLESGGSEDEPIYPLRNQFQDIGLTEAFQPILVKTAPTPAIEQVCGEAGVDLGQWVTRDRTIKQMKSLDSQLDRALGRLSGGLYLLTAQKGDLSSAMIASWVMQASLEPLGVAIAVAKDRAIEALLHPGDHFVLNVLQEGKAQPLMKHFLKRFAPGSDRFAGIKTYTAINGSLILADSLAYLECTVTSRLENNDHWIVYSTVQTGRVAQLEALTAVHHRKVSNHY